MTQKSEVPLKFMEPEWGRYVLYLSIINTQESMTGYDIFQYLQRVGLCVTELDVRKYINHLTDAGFISIYERDGAEAIGHYAITEKGQVFLKEAKDYLQDFVNS